VWCLLGGATVVVLKEQRIAAGERDTQMADLEFRIPTLSD